MCRQAEQRTDGDWVTAAFTDRHGSQSGETCIDFGMVC